MTQLGQKYPLAISSVHFPSNSNFLCATSLPYLANSFVPFVTLQERNHKGLFRSLQENIKPIQHEGKTKNKFHCFFIWFQFFELYIWTFIHEMRRNPKCLILVHFILFLNQTLFFIFRILCVDSVYKNGGKKNSLMKNTKWKRYKIMGKKGSEIKQYFETSSLSSENEKKSIESVRINFLLEILVFHFV